MARIAIPNTACRGVRESIAGGAISGARSARNIEKTGRFGFGGASEQQHADARALAASGPSDGCRHGSVSHSLVCISSRRTAAARRVARVAGDLGLRSHQLARIRSCDRAGLQQVAGAVALRPGWPGSRHGDASAVPSRRHAQRAAVVILSVCCSVRAAADAPLPSWHGGRLVEQTTESTRRRGDAETQRSQQIRALRPLLEALRHVESSGQANPPDGDGGRSIGPYQIKRVYFIDALRELRAVQSRVRNYEDVRDARCAEEVIVAYWARHAPASLRLATTPGVYARDQQKAIQTLARIHNGGPAGASKSAMLEYWERVKARLGK